jgi:16S rRNA (uracil1498-N3)-methyltransferase
MEIIMRLHRFYITNEIVEHKTLTIESSELVHQIQNVFRMKVGDHVIVFNGTGFDYECKIDGFEKKSKINGNSVIRLTVTGSKLNNFSMRRKLFLGAGIVKKDTFEWIVEKATELGVSDIIPIAAERSEKKSLNEERLRKISIEASEQSGRDTTPMVHIIMGVAGAVSLLKKENPGIKILAFHTCIGETSAKMMHRESLDKSDPLAVFIGPEGGWTPAEIEVFHREDIAVLCLGPQVLRAETAVVAALSVVVFG